MMHSEQVQFAAMLTPTLALIVASILTLVAPAGDTKVSPASEIQGVEQPLVLDTESGPLLAVAR